MSALDDIYMALQSGLESARYMQNNARHWNSREAAQQNISCLEEGVAAYYRLQRDLREGRKHIDPPHDYDPPPRTECYCSEPTCSPPCSWCTSGKEREEEEAAAMGKEAGK